jgi:hypothetical protein
MTGATPLWHRLGHSDAPDDSESVAASAWSSCRCENGLHAIATLGGLVVNSAEPVGGDPALAQGATVDDPTAERSGTL